MPVDWYNGGMEHVTRHLIYSKVLASFLYDIGVVNTPEPYAKRSAQRAWSWGLTAIRWANRRAMSSIRLISWISTVQTRCAPMSFYGRLRRCDSVERECGKGCKRFPRPRGGADGYGKGWGQPSGAGIQNHKTIKKVSSDIEEMKFNTAIASLMTLLNDIYAEGSLGRKIYLSLLSCCARLLPIFVRRSGLWRRSGIPFSCCIPVYDEARQWMPQLKSVSRCAGSWREQLQCPAAQGKEEAIETALKMKKITSGSWYLGILKEIYVPNKTWTLLSGNKIVHFELP